MYDKDEGFFKRFSRIYEDCNIPMLSKGMVYSTLVATVPCLAIIVAALNYLGLPNKLFELLSSFMQSTMGQEMGSKLEQYAETFTQNSASLGVTGIVSFLFIFMFLMDDIWTSLNRIYEGENTGIHFRFLRYIIFLLISSVLLISIVYLNGKFGHLLAFIKDIPETEGIGLYLKKVVPYLVLFALIWFSFRSFHSTGSCFVSAFIGSAICTALIKLLSWVFGYTIKYMVNYSIIYGSLASILLFLMYLSYFWTIFFSCAVLAHNIDVSILPDEQIYI